MLEYTKTNHNDNIKIETNLLVELGDTMHDNTIKSISKDYFDYLQTESKFIPLENETIEFYSPIVDYFGDSISVNISFSGDQYKLTDHGETLWNMEQLGIDLTSNKKTKKV